LVIVLLKALYDVDQWENLNNSKAVGIRIFKISIFSMKRYLNYTRKAQLHEARKSDE
jgi:hypothetical protein